MNEELSEDRVGLPEFNRPLVGDRRFAFEDGVSLDASVATLKGRDKILIDADKLPGTRKLYLMDPDLFPRTPPLAFPRDQRERNP